MVTIEQADRFADVPLEVQFELGRTQLRLRDILSLRVGRVLGTRRLAAEGVEVWVGGVRIGSARIVLSNKRVGVRLTSVEMPVALRPEGLRTAGQKT